MHHPKNLVQWFFEWDETQTNLKSRSLDGEVFVFPTPPKPPSYLPLPPSFFCPSSWLLPPSHSPFSPSFSYFFLFPSILFFFPFFGFLFLVFFRLFLCLLSFFLLVFVFQVCVNEGKLYNSKSLLGGIVFLMLVGHKEKKTQ